MVQGRFFTSTLFLLPLSSRFPLLSLACRPPYPCPAFLQVRKRKWDSYSSGEELFGLPVTQYPELERTQEEIVMLDKLYRWVGGLRQGG